MGGHIQSNLSSSQLLVSPEASLPPMETTTDHVRNIGNFPPSTWSQVYITSTLNDVDLSSEWRQIEELKDKVGTKFDLYADKPLQRVTLIDSIQQLGLGYLFQEQIDQALKSMINVDVDYGLHQMSLYFRLQRQHGHNVSSSIFKKFMGKDGALEEGFRSDVLGMVSFYEAAQLRVHADAEILDEALARCVTQLESMAADLNPRLKALVTNALKFPIHKNMPWLQARKYISTYQEDESHDKILLKLAKLHFNVLQKQHKQELSHLSKWWKDVDIVSKCPYARDRLVEGYFWALALYYEPHYSRGRKFFAMGVVYISVLDDTYDAYGTADELELITAISIDTSSAPGDVSLLISRFDTSLFEQMPPYAREICQMVFGVYSVMEEDLLKDGNGAHLPCVKEAMKLIVRSYHNEYLWLKKNLIPTMDEYTQQSFSSSAITTLLIFSLAAMGDIVTKAALAWILRTPKFVIAAQGIGRFLDDIVSHEFEQQRQHIPSAVECYMNQYKVSIEEACQYLRKQISDFWITLNEEFLEPTAFPFPVFERVLNIARSMEVVYEDGDGFTHSQKFMEPKITSLLKDPVPI